MKPINLFKAIMLAFLLLPFHSATSKTIYVSPSGTGTGVSWSAAMGDVQAAIDAAVSGDQVWVMAGTYKPHASDRNVSFTLKAGVRLYGGFQGTEIDLGDRVLFDADGNSKVEDWEFQYPTVLSGEIQDDGDGTNNSQHVVIIPTAADENSLINGFTIEGGYADVTTSTNDGPNVCGAGILALEGRVARCIVQNCTAYSSSSDLVSGAGIFALGVPIYKTKLEKCTSTNTSGSASVFGGGVYGNSKTLLDYCKIVSCSVESGGSRYAEGGGAYLMASHMLNTQVLNCSAAGNGYGGGISTINSTTIVNTVVANCTSNFYGGGMYVTGESYVANCVVARCSVTGPTPASGGGVYSKTKPVFYNTVFWKNVSSGYSAHLKLSDDGVAKYCAVEGTDLSGTGNINISSDNIGDTDGVLYPAFVNPTSYTGVSDGTGVRDNELLMSDWNIRMSSSLIDMGSSDGLNEAYLINKGYIKAGSGLNGDGDQTDESENFTDLAGENRHFNFNVDIGAYENIFIDLVLPTASDLEYGRTLADVVLTGGSARDNRDDSDIPGTFAFYEPSFKPDYSEEPQKFRIAFTAEDNTKYPVHYDTVSVLVSAQVLTIDGLTAEDKVYDGTTDVVFDYSNAKLVGVVDGDDVSLTQTSIAAAFEDKNAGVDKSVVVSGYSLAGADKDNYFLDLKNSITATITPRPVSVTTLNANDKVYDGTKMATYNEVPEPVGTLVGDDLSIDASAAEVTFDTKHVGADKPVTFSGFALAGDDKDNYAIEQPTASSASITKLTISITGVTVGDKEYDGTTVGVISGDAVAAGIIEGDNAVLNTSEAHAHFDVPNVGTNKPVIFSGYVLEGDDAANYEYAQPAMQIASITEKELTIEGLTVTAKDYDGTVTATITGTAALVGVISGEDVDLNASGITAVYDNANAGVGKVVTVSGFSLSGAGIANYNLSFPVLSGDINKFQVDVKAQAASKTYGDTDPVFTYVSTPETLVGADSFTGGVSREPGEDVGTYNIVQGTLTLTDNYEIIFSENVFTINQAPNSISFTLDSPVEFEEGKKITLSATATSGEIVLFASSDAGIAQISGPVLTMNNYGTVTITATENTNQNYEVAAPVDVILTINPRVTALRKGDNMLLIDNVEGLFAEDGYQWYKNGSAISGAQKQYYYSENGLEGDYYCKVTTGQGDKLNSNTIVVTSTQSISLYPSPAIAGTTFNVSLNGFESTSIQNEVIEVYSLTGELIKQINNPTSINKVTLDKPGVYIVKTNGNRLSKKIIVK